MGNLSSHFRTDTNNKLQVENSELNTTILTLKEEIKELKSKLNLKPEAIDALENRLQESVTKLVDNILENESVNSSIIPDYIEKKIYTNIFTILIGILKEILEDTSINILNQNISFKISPKI